MKDLNSSGRRQRAERRAERRSPHPSLPRTRRPTDQASRLADTTSSFEAHERCPGLLCSDHAMQGPPHFEGRSVSFAAAGVKCAARVPTGNRASQTECQLDNDSHIPGVLLRDIFLESIKPLFKIQFCIRKPPSHAFNRMGAIKIKLDSLNIIKIK